MVSTNFVIIIIRCLYYYCLYRKCRAIVSRPYSLRYKNEQTSTMDTTKSCLSKRVELLLPQILLPMIQYIIIVCHIVL